jgi:RNA polymerase sigma factor (sigma-70 family)
MTIAQQKELLEEVQQSPQAFAKVFDVFYQQIFNYVLRRTGDYQLTCDITAETFLKAFLNINKFTWRGISLSAWLFRIATNEMNYYFRKKRYEPQHLSQLKDLASVSHNPLDDRTAAEQHLKEMQDFARVRRALEKLDIKYQEVISLRYFEEKDNRSISEILGKPEGTIKSLLSRGLEKLRMLINSATKDNP